MVGAAVDGVDEPAVPAVAGDLIPVFDDQPVPREGLAEGARQGLAGPAVVLGVHLGVGAPVVVGQGAAQPGAHHLLGHALHQDGGAVFEGGEFGGGGRHGGRVIL